MRTADELATAGGRLTGRREWCWYIVAAASYIAAGMGNKWLLNWLLGPLWLVAVVCLGPPFANWVHVLALRAARAIGGRR